MAIGQALEGFAFDLLQRFELELQLLAEAAHQLSGNDQLPAVAALANAVVEPAIDGDGQVGRQGPRGGGPDGDRQAIGAHPSLRQGWAQLLHREGHKHAGRGMPIGVFQFGFSQRCARAGAPVHRLESPVDVAGQHHAAEHIDLGRLVALLQGQIGGIPFPPNAPAAKALALAFHLLLGVGVGFAAQLEGFEFAPLLRLEALQHLEFNR